MADGPRCKRRKQANPRRNNVTNYSNVVEANSESDDEDKLHIVEEDSLPDEAGEDDVPVLPAALGLNGPVDHQDRWNGMGEDTLGPEAESQDVGFPVKEECMSEGEEECSTDAMVEEILQQGDTAVIYPEAPEDEPRQGTPDVSGHDENGTPDAFSQLLTCPYCSRGYKRYASLKEHIKYRHEKSEDNFSCSLCSYTFTHRTQLDRHMSVHKSGREQRHVTPTGGNRKFKCTECGKAFKYKHHLKEHLRIHSGEKPYECSNCKKRFSHSGSYSSHISSKKCIGLISVNGRPRPASKASQCTSPALPASPSAPTLGRTQLREKVENGRPLQEQLPINQIKTEPVDYEYKPVVMAPSINGVFNGGTTLQAATTVPQGLVQAVVLPTVGLVSPISINLNDIQNVLKVAVDGNVIRQMLGSTHTNVVSKDSGATGQTQPAAPSVISAISLPIVDQDGTTKIIINYNLDPNQTQLTAQSLKKEADISNGSMCKAEKLPEDLTVKVEKSQKAEAEESANTCLLCEDCPGGLADTLHDLKHCKAKGLKINGVDASKSDPTIPCLLSDGNLSPGQPPLKNLLSLLKAYYALNAEPTKEELSKISDSVNLPLDVVRKWFEKMHTGQIPVGSSSPPPGQEAPRTEPDGASPTPPPGQGGTATAEMAAVCSEPCAQDSEPVAPLSPLNLSAGGLAAIRSEQDSEEPLDLSLPKLPRDETDGPAHQNSVYSVQEEPLNLTCTKRDPPESDTVDASPAALFVPTPSANPINIVTTQLPTLVAIADQGSVPCLRALSTNNKTILIPQLTYTYSTSGNSPMGTEAQQKTAQVSSNQEDTSSEGVSTVEDQNDSDSTPPRKRMRKTESGMYACDLCDKIFQKSSSLLRHKYEHTGKRPHECGICSKAFKHKHHLIEHMRLHSGEKPYQCDKCGKRFSHSGSYSQHMNHRYSYCKKEAQERGDGGSDPGPLEEMALPARQLLDGPGASPPSHLDSDDRESSTREDDEESEEEEEEEDLGDVGVNEDEIRVVRIGEDDEQGDSGGGEEEMEFAAEGEEGEETGAKEDGEKAEGSQTGDPEAQEEGGIEKDPDPMGTETTAASEGTVEMEEENEGQNETVTANDHKVQMHVDQVSDDRESMTENGINVK